MKIVILVDQLHSHGGIEKLVALKANYWTTVFGHDVTIISTEQNNETLIYELDKKVKFVDLDINYKREISYFSFVNIKKLIKNIFQLQSNISTNKPDFILVASHIPMTYVLPFLRLKKAKTIKEFHFTKFYDTSSGIKNKILNYIESKYNFLVVLSQEEQNFYPSTNTVVIPNPIEKEVEIIIPILERPNIAVAVLRFAPVKRLEIMVSIWEKFSKINTSWKLHIYGTTGNDYYTKISNIVKDKQLENSIIFKGQTNDVSNALMNSKVLLITSQQECFPMVILEANAVGIPVISFDCPTGPRNIIHHEIDGFLVNPTDEDAFVAYLEKLSNKEEILKSLSINAIKNGKNYTIQKVMSLWNNVIFAKS
ncbi:glycosyltransferase [Flavobacterium sp.]|uniref:glycosyltransferase n=1 Tax=Flavobacterium sp. TaxID=239 RepID=UPI003750212A